jgi:hypothetical protein
MTGNHPDEAVRPEVFGATPLFSGGIKRRWL